MSYDLLIKGGRLRQLGVRSCNPTISYPPLNFF